MKINANSFAIGQAIIVTGNFNVQSDGNYYIEFGLDESSKQTLAILKSSQSACDQSRHYAGVWANDAKAGEIIPFQLALQDYGETGRYDVVGGVYSRCGIGSDIASAEPVKITITSAAPASAVAAPAPTNSNLNPPMPAQPVTQCTPSGYFKSLSIRVLGNKEAIDNAKARVVGTFHNAAPCTVTYYIEAGMLQSSYKPLSIVTGKPSACDENVHFSGVKVSVPANADQIFSLTPANYGIDGKFTLQGGVYYNGGKFCGNADIASFREQEVIFAGFGTSDIDNSWIDVI